MTIVGDLKITSASTERQKRSQNLAPVLVIISGNSLVFSRKIITSTGFYRCCAPGASAPVVVKNQSPILGSHRGCQLCAEEMRQESVGISNRLLTPCHTRLRRPPRGPFSYQGVSTRGVRHSPDLKDVTLEDGKGWGHKRGDLKMPFST